MKSHYSISVFWSAEDNGFIALVSEFPGLSAFGETREEAVKEAEIALSGMIDLYQEEGDPLPDPTSLPGYSGQLRIRIPKDLHASLARNAQVQGVSLNTLIVHKLSQAPDQEELLNIKSEIKGLSQTMAACCSELHKIGGLASEVPLRGIQEDARWGTASLYTTQAIKVGLRYGN